MLVAASAAASKPIAAWSGQAPGRSAGTTPPRLAPRAELVNTLEYEAQAKAALAPAAFARIAGGDRAAFDRITLRPRMLVSVTDMDLGVTLFGDALFAPIRVAPIADQKAAHAGAEAATARGASAARTPLVVNSRTSVPLATLVPLTTSPVWFQVFTGDPAASATNFT
jgi:4-hydroxymandelate oxidase